MKRLDMTIKSISIVLRQPMTQTFAGTLMKFGYQMLLESRCITRYLSLVVIHINLVPNRDQAYATSSPLMKYKERKGYRQEGTKR